MKKTKRKTCNIFQNCAFMISRAWRDCKSVLVIVLGIILCGVAASLLELFWRLWGGARAPENLSG